MQFSSFFFKMYPNSETGQEVQCSDIRSLFGLEVQCSDIKSTKRKKKTMLTLFRTYTFLKIISLSLIYMILSNADLLHRSCHLAQVVWIVWLLSAKASGRLCVQKGRWRSSIFYFTSFILRDWNLTNMYKITCTFCVKNETKTYVILQLKKKPHLIILYN